MRVTARRLIIALAAAGLLAGCQKGASSAGSGGDAMTAPEMSLGNPNAKVTVVEYASDTCSHCARFATTVFPAFKTKYVDTGKVRYVFREFLTPPEQVSAAGFLLARCAGKDKYFQVIDAEFRGQQQMFESGDAKGTMLGIAKTFGLDEKQFNDCVQNETALKALGDRVQKAQDVDHITGTPTLIVNGKTLAEGEVTLAQLDAAIQPLLAK
ncbi:DsbA family protein [Caulobacter sp. S45]|jgi:protein-disulfide isomerase|uniref:DsbA family protein n=1 Tax=Caulobacter sp. S45 TaxID=1641861 RepID=UPI00131E27C7|nr:DsbA family protein [Caulobacter sp. S45]